MLSDPADYEGGLLQHLAEGEDEPLTTRLRRGDVAFYRSHQVHRVTPLTAGVRLTMAFEWWHLDDSYLASKDAGDQRVGAGWGGCPR